MSTRLVIASFRENLNWLRHANLPCPVTVLNSGTGSKWWEKQTDTYGSHFFTHGDVECSPCDNVGKEAGQYLQYIISDYDRLADRTIFIQADMGVGVFIGGKPKRALVAQLVSAISKILESPEPVGAISIDFEPLPPKVVPFPDETHPILGEILKPNERPTHTIAGHVGAQFWVDRALVRKFPVSYYKQVLGFGSKGFLAHHLEFVWPSVFQPDVHPPSDTQPQPVQPYDPTTTSPSSPL